METKRHLKTKTAHVIVCALGMIKTICQKLLGKILEKLYLGKMLKFVLTITTHILRKNSIYLSICIVLNEYISLDHLFEFSFEC